MNRINLAVIFGGRSGEHEISLKSAKQVMEALNEGKYNVIPIAINKKGHWLIGEKGKKYLEQNIVLAGQEGGADLEQSQSLVDLSSNEQSLTAFAEGDTGGNKIDLVLPIMHGPYGEDGKLQGMLDMLGIPYVFSGTLASALGMNKRKSKLIAKSAGVKIAKEVTVTRHKKYDPDKIIAKLSLPIVIKPAELGSSVGVNIAKTKEELEAGIQKALSYGHEAMLEQFIKGRELTVAVFGNKSPKAFPVTEIIPKVSNFYDYMAKYQDGGSQHVCPAEIPQDIFKKVQKSAVKIFKAIGCADLARADFIWNTETNKIYFLEINTIPGMTSTSLAPEAARAAGMEFPAFLDKLIVEAMKRCRKFGGDVDDK